MYFDKQNLTDGRLPMWRHGRAWWGRLRAEWVCFYHPRLAIGFSLGGYDDTRVSCHLCLLAFSIYISFDTARFMPSVQFSAAWFGGNIQLHLFTTDEDWIRDRPWHRNCVTIRVKEWFTGCARYECINGEPFSILIPMPEGCYAGTAAKCRSTWTYRLGFKTVQEGYEFHIPNGGIPFSGKGENSWDCGDDGLCGKFSSGTVEDGIGNVVASVLNSRRRYGSATHLRNIDPVFAPSAPQNG